MTQPMDRRQLLIRGSALGAAGLPILAGQSSAAAKAASASTLFKGISFADDGLAFTPREYATLLGTLTGSQDVLADNYSNGGFVEELEGTFARLLGKERAIFLPTGTLANHLAVRTLAGLDRRVLLQAESHLFNDSGDCLETLSGLKAIPLGAGHASLDSSEVRAWIDRSATGRVETRVGVISIENPVRRMDHQFVDPTELTSICNHARERGIRLHLDGARLFALPLHTGRSVRDHAAPFDTVYVSLWKHFNGASGGILAGETKIIEGMFHTRRMFGGSLPQAWPEIALAPKFLETFQDDYAKSWVAADELIALLGADQRFKVRRIPNGTSRFLLEIPGVAPDPLIGKLQRRGVKFPHARAETSVFPMQVNPTILRSTPAEIMRTITDALAG
jgi:threonine aldolase